MLTNIENPKALEIDRWPEYVAYSLGYRKAMLKMKDLTEV